MNGKMSMILIVVLIVGVGVVAAINRVALNALRLRTVEETRHIAEKQTLENWEIFFRNALNDLGREIGAQERKLADMRSKLIRDRAQWNRAKETLQRYENTLSEFAEKVKASAGGEVRAFGRAYAPEEAQTQLREFAGAVVDQRNKEKTLGETVAFMETQIREIENALRVAREQMASLQKRGEQMVRERALAELKATTLEMSGAVAGLDPNAPLTGAMRNVNDLLMRMQTHIDTVGAAFETAATDASGARVMTVQQALRQLDYSRRDAEIEATVRAATESRP